jgi:regulator of sigma E protease
MGNYAVTVGVLALILFIHAVGRYLVARWCGMRVERFRVGVGPGILKRESKQTGTRFEIRLIPFGCFVEVRGEHYAEDDPDDTHAAASRSAWRRLATSLAGPAANYLSTVAVAMALLMIHGVDAVDRLIHVADVLHGYDAVGKLERGDQILLVDGEPLLADVGPSLTERVSKKQGAPVALTIRRAGKVLDVEITPKPGEDKQGGPRRDHTGNPIYLLGIAPTRAVVLDVGVIEAARLAIAYPIEQTKVIVVGFYGGFYDAVFGSERTDPGGPVRIVEDFRQEFTHRLISDIRLFMLLSLYVGLISLIWAGCRLVSVRR